MATAPKKEVIVAAATSPVVYDSDSAPVVPAEGETFADPNEIVVQDTPARIDPETGEEATQSDEVVTTDDEIPAEYKDKTPAQLVKMLAHTQVLLGRHAKEVGELRSLADQQIRARLTEQAARANAGSAAGTVVVDQAVEDAKIFADPRKAIADIVSNHPEVVRLRAQNQQFAADALRAKLERNQVDFTTAHSDFQEVLADPEFQKWVSASKVRVQLLKNAHEKYDVDAGNEVFGSWKELKAARAVTPAAKAAATEKRAATRKAVTVPTAGGGGGSPADSAAGGKIYRRADIIKLMEEKPDRYMELAPEIELAYRQGRVR